MYVTMVGFSWPSLHATIAISPLLSYLVQTHKYNIIVASIPDRILRQGFRQAGDSR